MIELDAVSKRYGDVVAVAELCLGVERGECLCLLGGSGCGKTTTLKMVNRLVEPSAGRILLEGRDTRETPPFELRRRMAFRERMPEQLSGGQQQRVGLARALAAEPEVLLLDEPFGALDPLTRDRLQQAFQRIRRDLGITVLFVTHDMVEALLVGDRIAVLDGGRLLQIGTPHELLTRPVDDVVGDLMATPRRQARALEGMLGRETRPAEGEGRR